MLQFVITRQGSCLPFLFARVLLALAFFLVILSGETFAEFGVTTPPPPFVDFRERLVGVFFGRARASGTDEVLVELPSSGATLESPLMIAEPTSFGVELAISVSIIDSSSCIDIIMYDSYAVASRRALIQLYISLAW
jgi:hypothetical protein